MLKRHIIYLKVLLHETVLKPSHMAEAEAHTSLSVFKLQGGIRRGDPILATGS